MTFARFFFALFFLLPLSVKADLEALIRPLMEVREPEAFEAAYRAAEKGGVPRQALLETRFLYLVDQGNDSKLAAFSKELKAHLPALKIKDSVIFAVPEDFQSIVEYTLALAALENNQSVDFEKHIKEAFWLSPSQAQIYARHIDEVRLKKAMTQLKFDFSRTIEKQSDDKRITLKQEIGDAPAILFHFWSAWARESLDSMPDFFATAVALEKHKIPVANILLAGNAEAKKTADELRSEWGKEAKGSWLIDSEKGDLASLFRVKTFPTVVLLSRDGLVLFNGHPRQLELWDELKKLKPSLVRPQSPEK